MMILTSNHAVKTHHSVFFFSNVLHSLIKVININYHCLVNHILINKYNGFVDPFFLRPVLIHKLFILCFICFFKKIVLFSRNRSVFYKWYRLWTNCFLLLLSSAILAGNSRNLKLLLPAKLNLRLVAGWSKLYFCSQCERQLLQKNIFVAVFLWWSLFPVMCAIVFLWWQLLHCHTSDISYCVAVLVMVAATLPN